MSLQTLEKIGLVSAYRSTADTYCLLLIDLPTKEAQLIELYEEMLIQHHTLRIKRKTFVLLNTKLFSLWDDHQNNYV